MSLKEDLGITMVASGIGGGYESAEEGNEPEEIENGVLSVIIPAYNVRDWIERCIESVKRQGDIVREIIVVNDGSKDGTEEIVRRLQGKYGNLRLINQDNQGALHARIHGVRQALGEYVTFADADDYLEKGIYHKLLSLMKYNQADILEYGIRKVKNGRVIYEFIPGKILCDEEEAIRRMLEKDGSQCSNCNRIYKRCLFSELEFNETIRINGEEHEEDKFLNVKVMARAEQVMLAPLAGYIYDTREGSATTKALTKGYLSLLDSSRAIYKFIKSEKPSLSKAAGRDFCAHLVFCYINLSRMKLNQNEIKTIKKTIANEFRFIYETEKIGSYTPKSESKNRTCMLNLFRLSPAISEMIYRAGGYLGLLR